MISWFIGLLLSTSPLNAAEKTRDFCSVRLSGVHVKNLDRLIYAHAQRIQKVASRLPEVFVEYRYREALKPILEPGPTRLPAMYPPSAFNVWVFATPYDFFVTRGSVRMTEVESGKEVEELRMEMKETSLTKPLPDKEMLAILLALSSVSKLQLLSLGFDLDKAEEARFSALLKRTFYPDEIIAALNSPAIEQFVKEVPFKLMSFSLAEAGREFPANARFTFDTRAQ